MCLTDEQSRAFLEAVAPAHRLRLLSLVAMEHVAKAYYLEEASRRPAVLHAKQVENAVNDCDSGGHPGAFPVDPLVVSAGASRGWAAPPGVQGRWMRWVEAAGNQRGQLRSQR